MGNPDTTTYPGGRTVMYGHDELERIATIHSSQGGEAATNLLAQYQYLGAGRVERRTLAGNGTQLDYEFDTIGRVNATVHAIAATSAVFDDRTYVWDKANNKTQRVEWYGAAAVKTHDYEYDSLNRLVRSTKTVDDAGTGTAGNWTGDMDLNSATPDEATIAGGELLGLLGDFNATFDPGTLEVFVTKVRGTRDEAVDYPAVLEGYTATQIDALAPARPDQGTFDLYASALNGATRVYSNPVPITYGPRGIEYDLDGAGNRDAVETGPGALNYDLDATAPNPADAQMNQYTLTPLDTSDRVYDENGNLQATDAAVYRHDYLDRIYDMDDGAVVATYLYDALGRRIEKTVDDGVMPVTTRYLHDGARVAEEWVVPSVGNPTLSASYVYGLYIDEVLTMRRGGVDYYYHGDDMHNVVKLTDNNGAVLEAYDYADYGQPEFFDATGNELTGTAYANPYLFTGREWDDELGYYYYRNRYMDPAQGRFASRDPLGLWGDPLNLGNGYTYAGSNPWSLVDPFGLCSGNEKGWIESMRDAIVAWGDSVFLDDGEENYELQREDFESDTDYYVYRQTILGDQVEGVVPRDYYSNSENPERMSNSQIWDATVSSGTEYTVEMGKEVTRNTATAIITGLILRQASGTKLLPGPSGGPTVKHHIFNVFRGSSPKSQKYRDFFFKHGINVDDYTVEVPAELHREWVHRAGTNWTTSWKRWIDANPSASTKEVYQQAGRMMDEYGLNGLPIVPY